MSAEGRNAHMMVNPIFEAFLDGFTGGALFAKLRQPGTATQLFADDPEEVWHGAFEGASLNAHSFIKSYPIDAKDVVILLESLDSEIANHGVEAATEAIHRFKERLVHGTQS